MLNALLTIPWFIMTFLLSERTGLWSRLTDASMLLVSTGICIFTLLTFRALLNWRYAFHATDRFIEWQIKVNVVATAVSILGMVVPSIAESAGMVGIVLVILLGVIQLVFGLRLQQLSADLNGLRRPYSYLNIITGFCLATIVLVPLGMLTSAISDIMLGTIFFQASTTTPTVDTEA